MKPLERNRTVQPMTRARKVAVLIAACLAVATQVRAWEQSPRPPIPVALMPATVPLTRSAPTPIPPPLAAPITPPEPAVPSLRVLPPAEYDHPYRGKLTIERSTSQEYIRSKCGPTIFPYHLGCAFLQPTGCFILMADDATIRKHGWTTEIVRRHEESHCGGWPSHHPGARAP